MPVTFQETSPARSKPVSFSARLLAEVKDKTRDEKPAEKKKRGDEPNSTDAEVKRFVLNTRRLPARLHAHEVAPLLNFSHDDIAALVSAGLLVPLGNPKTANTPKYFATVEIDRCANDAGWLNHASAVVIGRNRTKNERRKVRPSASSECSLAD